jgi:hypothetical protein
MTKPFPYSRLEISPKSLLIMLAPVSVFLVLEFVLKSLGDPTLEVPKSDFPDGSRLIELAGRYKFLAAFAFFGAVSLAVLAIFVLDLLSNYSKRTALWSGVALLLCAAVGVLFSVAEPDALGAFEMSDLVGHSFFMAALGNGNVGICAVTGSGCTEIGAMHVFRTVAAPINVLTSFSLAAAMIGLILALAQRPDCEAQGAQTRLEKQAAELVSARAVSQRYLYCAGILLTSGITFLYAWMRWPAELIGDDVLRQSYMDLTGALALYVGVGYSVLILAGYLPVMLIIARRTERFRFSLVSEHQATAGKVLESLDVPEVKYFDALKSIVAILSPILASSVGTFGQGVVFS